MSFFDNDFLLLSSAQQTFLAAIATLVVLCSYKGNSNFLASLNSFFKEVFHKDIRHKIEGLSKQSYGFFAFMNECKVFLHSSVVSDDDKDRLLDIQFQSDTLKNRFFNKAVEDRIVKSQESFDNQTKANDEKQFPLFIAFFTFVIVVAILTIDSLNFNCIVGGFILFLFDYVFLIMTIAGWVEYWKDDVPTDKKIHNPRWLLWIFVLLISIPFLLNTSDLMKIVLISISVLFISVFLYNFIIEKCKRDDYNIRAIARFEVFWMARITVFAIVMYFVFQYDFFYKAAPAFVQKRFDIIIDNYSFIVNNICLWRKLFIVLCVLNAFILPLLLKFLYDRKNWRTTRGHIENDYNIVIKEIDNLRNQYSDLKKEILT